METLFILELLILLCMTYIRVSLCYSKTIGFFRKVRDHPNLNLCAVALFRQTRFVGARVHTVTGVCEVLPRDWDFSQTMDGQYSYVKRLNMQEIFYPPLLYTWKEWPLPGLFRNGARLEVTGRLPTETTTGVYYSLTDDDLNNAPVILWMAAKNNLEVNKFINGNKHPMQMSPKTDLDTSNTFRLAFVAEKTSMRVFLDEQELHPKYESALPLPVTQFYTSPLQSSGPFPALFTLKFINEDD